MAFLFKGGSLIQVKITKKDKHGTATGWPRPLNRGGCLIQVPNTAFVSAKNRDFKNWPLNRGWPLNTGPLYTGSTVFPFPKPTQDIARCKRWLAPCSRDFFTEKT